MTVLTKMGISEKKDQLPLVDENSHNEMKTEETTEDSVLKYIVIHKSKAGGKPPVSNYLCCLFLLALVVVSAGVLGGVLLYQQYGALSEPRYNAWCSIPSNMANLRLTSLPQFRIVTVPDAYFASSRDVEMLNAVTSDGEGSLLPDYLSESFDIGADYERIIVSDFRDGRHSNILHDFSTNMTGIVDSDRCFVHPINPKVVMQPKLFVTAIQSQSQFDLSTVHETMRAVWPAVRELTELGYYIGKECANRPTYMLEKQTGTIKKRSVDTQSSAQFAHFSGKHIQEIDIVNIDELLAYEERTTGMV